MFAAPYVGGVSEGPGTSGLRGLERGERGAGLAAGRGFGSLGGIPVAGPVTFDPDPLAWLTPSPGPQPFADLLLQAPCPEVGLVPLGRVDVTHGDPD